MLLRIDNIFYNTLNVEKLAKYYTKVLSYPIRRSQLEGSGINWMEINVGGMELSFRRFEGTEEVHPDLKDSFLELPPGNGATISFEVKDIQSVIGILKKKGVQFVTDIIKCTDGRELIAIFKDPFGKPVQLYESLATTTLEAELDSRAASIFVNEINNFVSSNIRSVQGLAMSVTMYVDDLEIAQNFYESVLELKVVSKTNSKFIIDVDGSLIEICNTPLSKKFHRNGVSVVIEVLGLKKAIEKLNFAKYIPSIHFENYELVDNIDYVPTKQSDITYKSNRAILTDIDGNYFELWEKSNSN